MVISTVEGVRSQGLTLRNVSEIPLPRNVLFCTPTFFKVEYAINPYMLDDNGKAFEVDVVKATDQWKQLVDTYDGLGLKIQFIDGEQGLPDMVFAANQTLPFPTLGNLDAGVILSNMNNSERNLEVGFYQNWFEAMEYNILTVKEDHKLEGMGDVLWHWDKRILWGGFGFRTKQESLDLVSDLLDTPILSLELVSEYFYHLDTCFSILNQDTVCIVPEAFSPQSLELIKFMFSQIIPINLDEAKSNFAGNCHCVDGRNVVIQKGSVALNNELAKAGLNVLEKDTSEFIKSGGSVFCLKQMFF